MATKDEIKGFEKNRFLPVVICLARQRETTKVSVKIMSYYPSRYSPDGIAIGYRLDEQGVGVRVPVGSRIFTSPCRPAHPASYPMGIRGSFSWDEAAGA
jgi:hypothetical protein